MMYGGDGTKANVNEYIDIGLVGTLKLDRSASHTRPNMHVTPII